MLLSGSAGMGRAVRKLWLGCLLCLSACGKEGVREWTPADHDVPPNAAAAPTRPGRASAAVDAQAEMVELTWQRQCASCHGPQGRGDGPQGPSSQAADLTKRSWQDATPDAQIAASILNGKGRMPKFDLPPPLVQGLVQRIRARKQP